MDGANKHSSEKTISITEKFVICNNNSNYILRYFKSDLYLFPNRKFSGLKIREKNYWNFSYVSQKKLSESEVKFLSIIQTKGKEAIEYDYAITKYTTNQIIIKNKKNYRQLVMDSTLSISSMLKLN
ncbi:MAG: hypothetical protein KDD29_10345 [Flavobacteriales bacterium]|nr:hypothetical protein [Flavobacteriales bacterium]